MLNLPARRDAGVMPWSSMTGHPRTTPIWVPNPLHCDSVSFCMADINHILKTTSFCYYYS